MAKQMLDDLTGEKPRTTTTGTVGTTAAILPKPPTTTTTTAPSPTTATTVVQPPTIVDTPKVAPASTTAVAPTPAPTAVSTAGPVAPGGNTAAVLQPTAPVSSAGPVAPGTNPGIVPPNILPAAPSVPGTGATLSEFGPGQDLRTTQVTPGASPLASQTNSALAQMLQQLQNGPDRAQLAQSMFDTFATGTQGAYQHALTDATRMAAANGRLGSGMLTNQYGDLANQRQVQLDTARDAFLNNALSGTISDRLNNLGAVAGLQGQMFGQDAAGRNELRTERDYQTGQGQYADQQAIQLALLQEQLLSGAFGRQMDQAKLLGSLGFGGSPVGAMQSGADLYGQQAAAGMGGLSDALTNYMLAQAMRGNTGGR